MELRVIESEAIEIVLNSINTLVEVVCAETNDVKSRFDEEWIESSELATLLGVSKNTIHNYKKQGLIGHTTIGCKLYFKRSEIVRILKPKLKKELNNNGANNKKRL